MLLCMLDGSRRVLDCECALLNCQGVLSIFVCTHIYVWVAPAAYFDPCGNTLYVYVIIDTNARFGRK